MSSPTRRCPGCGAEAPRSAARYCEQCGRELPPAESLPPPDPIGDRAARFAALKAHPELAGLLHATPAIPELGGKVLPSLAGLLLLSAACLAAALVLVQMCPPLGFALAAAVPIAAFALARRLLRTARAPLTARPALVTALRAQLQAGARHSHSGARHFVTLEDDSGDRLELECYPSARAELEVGRMGVGYVKGDRLAAFAPLAV